MVALHACGPAAPATGRHTTGGDVADVVRLYVSAYRRRYAVSPAQERVITASITCRTAQRGGHAEQCPPCGCERYAYHSCRNRHCPTCQTFTKGTWLHARQAELLPGPYVHPVCTLPHTLHGLIQANPRQLLSLLLHRVGYTLTQFGRHQLGGQRGATLVLHTWDQALGAHVHLHCLMPAGALDAPNERWVPSQPTFLFPVHALREVVRGQCVEALNQAHDQGQVGMGTLADGRENREDFGHLREPLYANKWVV